MPEEHEKLLPWQTRVEIRLAKIETKMNTLTFLAGATFTAVVLYAVAILLTGHP